MHYMRIITSLHSMTVSARTRAQCLVQTGAKCGQELNLALHKRPVLPSCLQSE